MCIEPTTTPGARPPPHAPVSCAPCFERQVVRAVCVRRQVDHMLSFDQAETFRPVLLPLTGSASWGAAASSAAASVASSVGLGSFWNLCTNSGERAEEMPEDGNWVACGGNVVEWLEQVLDQTNTQKHRVHRVAVDPFFFGGLSESSLSLVWFGTVVPTSPSLVRLPTRNAGGSPRG